MKKVGLIVFILFAAFITIGYLLPKQVHVERSITIERPADMLFTILNSYQHHNEWSPWAQRDPNAEFVVSGPESGVGARLSWIGEPPVARTFHSCPWFSSSQEVKANTSPLIRSAPNIPGGQK